MVSVKSTALETHTSPGNNTGSTTDLATVIDKLEPRALYLDLSTTNDPDKHSNDDGFPATENHNDGPVMDSVDDGLVTDDNLDRHATQDGLVTDDNLDRDDTQDGLVTDGNPDRDGTQDGLVTDDLFIECFTTTFLTSHR